MCSAALPTRGVARKVDLNLNFSPSSAQLTPQSKRVLDRFAEAVNGDEALALCCFRIEGHTDQDGSAEQNKCLSNRRAEAVKSYLVTQYVTVRARSS